MQEWAEYLSLYPLAEDRSEVQLAVLSSLQAVSKKVTYKDFLVSHQEGKKLVGKELEEFIIGAF